MALASLRANTLRSVLTMLGIVIGIAAVIAMIALGTGAQRSVQERIQALGTTLLQVNPQRVRRGGVQWSEIRRLTRDDAVMLRERAQFVAEVQPQQDRSAQVVWRNQNTYVRITGTTPNYLRVHNVALAAGRMFTAREERSARRVAVLGAEVLRDLGILSPQTLLGETIRIAGQSFDVVGVLASTGRASPFGNPDSQILVPFRAGQLHVFGNNRLNDIYVLARDESALMPAMAEVQRILRRAHRLRADQPDDFRIRSQADFLGTLEATTSTFTFLLAGIAAVSLLVGGIGIMNIMLVSVTERTREIGIRKALGATRRTILTQFLVEAVVLCLAGGAIGVLTGAAAAAVLRETLGWNTVVPVGAIALAFGFAAAIGVIFGVWPAKRAAVLNPVEALRYE